MKTLTRPRPHTTARNRAAHRSASSDRGPARRPSAQRITDAVTASYLHDISQRHRPEVRSPQSNLGSVVSL